MKCRRYPFEDAPHEIISRVVGDSFFASGGFLKLWKAQRGRAVYWVVEDDGSIAAVLPGIEFGSGIWRRFQALPDGCYARVFYDEGAVSSEYVSRLLANSIASFGYMKIFIYDYFNCLEPQGAFIRQTCHTTLVDIGSPDWLPSDKKLQSELRKAEREEAVITPFEPPKHFDKFMSLMLRTEQRHKRAPKYSGSFFRGLSELAVADDRIVWLWCEHEGEPVASHINFIEGELGLNWQVYYDKTFSNLKANQLMLYSFIQELKKRGKRLVNLGASPEEAAGLKTYKDKWGGKTYEYTCYSRKSWLGRWL